MTEDFEDDEQTEIYGSDSLKHNNIVIRGKVEDDTFKVADAFKEAYYQSHPKLKGIWQFIHDGAGAIAETIIFDRTLTPEERRIVMDRIRAQLRGDGFSIRWFVLIVVAGFIVPIATILLSTP